MSVFQKALLSLAVLCVVGSAFAQSSAKQTHFWMRIAPDKVIKFDPETDEVVLTVQSRHGISSGATLSHSKKELYLTTGQGRFVEVLDLEKGEIVDEYDFGEEGWIIRVDDVKEVPGNKHWWVKVDRVEKKLDHYIIAEPQWWYYDVGEAKVLKREKELPKEIRRGARISPDGTKWHVFDKDIKILDPKTLKEEGKIELSKPLYTGMGAISLQGEDLDADDLGHYRMLYSMRDPVKTDRTLMGMMTVDLEGKKIESYEEWGASPGVWGWHYTQDGKLAVGTKSSGRRFGGGGAPSYEDPETVLYTMSLETGKRIRETRIKSRNGLRLSAISPKGDKIYFSGRGHELIVHDAEHARLKTIELEGEVDRGILVVTQ